MNKVLLVFGIAASLMASEMSARGESLTGTVERVWEDGFLIQAGDRAISVDTWDVCGDNTQQHVAAGDELTVEGEFSDGEFDASNIINADGEEVCTSHSR